MTGAKLFFCVCRIGLVLLSLGMVLAPSQPSFAQYENWQDQQSTTEVPTYGTRSPARVSPGLQNDPTAYSPREKFEQFIDLFEQRITTFRGVVTNAVSVLFWLLATISLTWTAMFMALRGSDLTEIMTEFIRFTVTVGLSWWCLLEGPQIALLLLRSFLELGALASNNMSMASGLTIGPNSLNLTASASLAFQIIDEAKAQTEGASLFKMADIFIYIIIALLSAMTMLLISIILAKVYLTGWIVAFAGIAALGFGGNRWGTGIPMQYFKVIGGIGLQLMTMLLIQGIGNSFIASTLDLRDNELSHLDNFLVFACALFLFVLVLEIPKIVSLILIGGVNIPLEMVNERFMTKVVAANTPTGAVSTLATAAYSGGAWAMQAISPQKSNDMAKAAGSSFKRSRPEAPPARK